MGQPDSPRYTIYPGFSQLLLALLLSCMVGEYASAQATLHDARVAIKLKDYKKAHNLLTELAAGNDKEAQYQLAVLYRNGQGIKKDYKLAYKWFYQSAGQGYAKAEYNLGVMYHKGLGVKANLKLAKKWYLRAAKNKYKPAREQLAKLANPEQDSYDKLSRDNRFRALRAAIQNNDPALVSRIVKSDVNLEDKNGATALILASQTGKIDIARTVIDMGADINHADSKGMSAFHHACKYGKPAMVQLLLQEKIDYQKTDADGYTGMMHAAKQGHSGIVEYLLTRKKYASINRINKHGQTAYALAELRKHKDIQQLLLQHGASRGKNSSGTGHHLQFDTEKKQQLFNKWTPLMVSVWRGNAAETRRILLKDPYAVNQQDPEGYSALMLAALRDNTDSLKLLLRFKSKMNLKSKSGMTALALATENSKTNAVKMLLAHNADPDIMNNNGYTPLMLASQLGHKEIVNSLINNKARINIKNREGYGAIDYSIMNGHADILQILHEKGAGIATNNAHQSRLLIDIAGKNHFAVFKKLIQENNRTIVTRDALSGSLLIAAKNGYLDIVKLICEGQIDINDSDQYGNTPLLLSASRGQYKTTRFLIEKKADINKKDRYGNTPLMLAAYNGHVSVVELLLSKGANSNSRNNDRHNALDLARNSGHTEIATLIDSY